MGLMRLIKTIKGQTDTYTGSIDCSKSLDDVLELVRHFREKKDFWLGAHQVLKDVRNFGYYEIGKGPKSVLVSNPEILWHFTVRYSNNVATQVKVRLTTCCAKIVFEEFKGLLEKLPDVELVASVATVVEEEETAIDYSSKSLSELLNLFDEKSGKFLDAPNASTFAPMKVIKAEISKQAKELPMDVRVQFTQALSQIDTYMTAIDIQVSNSAMAQQISSFAGTYVSQIQTQILQMMNLVKSIPQD